VWWFNGAVLLGIFLVTAVRRIAPPAENHALITRGLALLTLAPLVPLSLFTTRMYAAREQLIFAAVILGVVCALELSSVRWPMAPHWRPWARHGGFLRWCGRIALPGWPSALPYMMFAGLLLGWAVHLPNLTASNDAWHGGWLVVLGMAWLVFPPLMLSFFGRAARAPLVYFGLLIGSCLLAPAAAVFSGTPNFREALSLVSIFPGAGFWITLAAPENISEMAFAAQAVVAFALLAGAVWRSRGYWDYLSRLDERVRTKG
jgi:hypothetical protein